MYWIIIQFFKNCQRLEFVRPRSVHRCRNYWQLKAREPAEGALFLGLCRSWLWAHSGVWMQALRGPVPLQSSVTCPAATVSDPDGVSRSILCCGTVLGCFSSVGVLFSEVCYTNSIVHFSIGDLETYICTRWVWFFTTNRPCSLIKHFSPFTSKAPVCEKISTWPPYSIDVLSR